MLVLSSGADVRTQHERAGAAKEVGDFTGISLRVSGAPRPDQFA